MTEDQFVTVRDLLVAIRDDLAGIRAMQAEAKRHIDEEIANRQEAEQQVRAHFEKLRRERALVSPLLTEEKGN